MPHAPLEPSSDLRIAANAMRQMYVALVNEGFSEEDALRIIGYILAGRTPSGG